MEVGKCINCGTEIQQNFCANCGQRTGVKRITLREGWNDFWARIYGFDGMFASTLRDLTIRPGDAARAYIGGNRARYYGPVGYFFLMVTIFLLLLDIFNVDGAEFFQQAGKSSGLGPEIKSGSEQEKTMQLIFQFMTDNMKIIFFAMIPFQAFFTRYLFFRKSGLNFIENSILPFYTNGHVYWISIAAVIIYKTTGVFLSNSISTIISTFYLGYAYANFFSYQARWKAFIKGIASYYFALFAFMIIAFIILISLIILFPEMREIFKPMKQG
jgi:hypothetical protein